MRRIKVKEELNFYSCTVSNFEQYTLARFIEGGHFEKHINRMRNHYRSERDALLSTIRNHPDYSLAKIKEENAGLHFLLTLHTDLSDRELIRRAEKNGIHISCLSEYFYDTSVCDSHTLVINYSGLDKSTIEEAVDRLFRSVSSLS